MSVFEKWLVESRKRPGATLAPGATMMPTDSQGFINEPIGSPTSQFTMRKQSARRVLVVEEKPIPVPIVPKELAPPSIVPPGIQYPTALLVGHEQNGGEGIPHTGGPVSIAHEEWPLGSLLFYIGSRVAISVGIYDKGDSMRDLLISYHRRNVKLRVHTGIGKAVSGAYYSRDEGPGGVGEPEGGRAVVPYDRPEPPRGGGYGGALERELQREKASEGQEGAWVPIIPGLPFNRPTLKQLEDTLKYFTSWADEFASWM